MKRTQENEIAKIVKQTLAGHFDHIRILKVEVRKDMNADGDDLLCINVIFKGEPKDLDAAQLLGTTRRLRPQLDKIHESAFPLLSFISQADYEAHAR